MAPGTVEHASRAFQQTSLAYLSDLIHFTPHLHSVRYGKAWYTRPGLVFSGLATC